MLLILLFLTEAAPLSGQNMARRDGPERLNFER